MLPELVRHLIANIHHGYLKYIWVHLIRLERYMQYDQMDADSEVNAALDIIAEFCTQVDDATTLPFRNSV